MENRYGAIFRVAIGTRRVVRSQKAASLRFVLWMHFRQCGCSNFIAGDGCIFQHQIESKTTVAPSVVPLPAAVEIRTGYKSLRCSGGYAAKPHRR